MQKMEPLQSDENCSLPGYFNLSALILKSFLSLMVVLQILNLWKSKILVSFQPILTTNT